MLPRYSHFCIQIFIEDLIFHSPSIRLPTGLLGALQTDEQHFGKGYGTMVVKDISKKVAQSGHDIYAGIFEKNFPSRRLFEKLGFEAVGEVHWITLPISWTAADDE